MLIKYPMHTRNNSDDYRWLLLHIKQGPGGKGNGGHFCPKERDNDQGPECFPPAVVVNCILPLAGSDF